jgi:hypothetical protein
MNCEIDLNLETDRPVGGPVRSDRVERRLELTQCSPALNITKGPFEHHKSNSSLFCFFTFFLLSLLGSRKRRYRRVTSGATPSLQRSNALSPDPASIIHIRSLLGPLVFLPSPTPPPPTSSLDSALQVLPFAQGFWLLAGPRTHPTTLKSSVLTGVLLLLEIWQRVAVLLSRSSR